MRVGIVTFHHANNYGSVWQVHALCEHLNATGQSAAIIDYRSAAIEKAMRGWRWRDFGLDRRDRYQRRLEKRFRGFRRKQLLLTAKAYPSPEALRDDPPEMDAYITGSDQVWNPTYTGGRLDPGYFLDFGPPGVRRVAYAVSLGSGTLAERHHAEFARRVSCFDAISLREATAVPLLRQVAGVEAGTVLDPVLLKGLPDSLALRPKAARRRYLFAFRTNRDPFIDATVNALSRQLGLRAYLATAYSSARARGREGMRAKQVCPTPCEWLGWIRHADLVVTNSFHATACSLLFRRDFLVAEIVTEARETNARMHDLLETIGLADRMVSAATATRPAELARAPIDWDAVHDAIDRLRGRSSEFLRHALEGA